MVYLQQVKISKTRFDKCSDFSSKKCRFLNEAKMTSILIARNSIYLFRNVEHKLHQLPSKSIYTSALRLCKADVKKSKLNEFGRILGLAKQDRKKLTCKKRLEKIDWVDVSVFRENDFNGKILTSRPFLNRFLINFFWLVGID